jgi:hypothetical protein
MKKYTYLQNYFDSIDTSNKDFEVKGLSRQQIKYLEKKLNNTTPFPKCFKEYLEIGGDYNGLPLEGGVSYEFYHLASKHVKKELAKRGTVIKRPITVFSSYEDCYSFIYLDEGDNPQPWNCSISSQYDYDDDIMVWKMPFDSFKELIDALVYRAVRGLGI